MTSNIEIGTFVDWNQNNWTPQQQDKRITSGYGNQPTYISIQVNDLQIMLAWSEDGLVNISAKNESMGTDWNNWFDA